MKKTTRTIGLTAGLVASSLLIGRDQNLNNQVQSCETFYRQDPTEQLASITHDFPDIDPISAERINGEPVRVCRLPRDIISVERLQY